MLFIILLLTSLTLTLGLNGPVVKVYSGEIQGYVDKSTGGRDFYAYQAIPYAQPPVGQFRFKPPRPFGEWTGIRNGSELGPICPQIRINSPLFAGVEDCLFLNVYVPKYGDWPRKRLPVLFWIHGGGFVLGSGRRDEYGPENQMDFEVVLVTINYRVGVLGFLATNDSNAYGNYGMMDQVLALKWVQKNIKYFGGDPEKVTIFGESAGGASVIYHLLSPLSKGLFSKAIAQSGTATMFVQDDALDHAKGYAQKFNCNVDDTAELMKCLRNQTPKDIVLNTNILLPVYFVPTVEPPGGPGFLPDSPRNLLQSGRIASKVPLIAGHMGFEGYSIHFALAPFSNSTGAAYFENEFPGQLPLFSDIQPFMTEAVNDIADHYYRNNTELDNSTVFTYVLSKLMGDCIFDSKITFDAEQLVKAGLPVYAYINNYIGQYCYSGYFGGTCGLYPSHGDDLFIEFPYNSPSQPLDADDAKMSRIMNSFWVQFAYESRVTLPNGQLWPKYRKRNPHYVQLNSPPVIKRGPLSNETYFWSVKIYNIVQSYLSP